MHGKRLNRCPGSRLAPTYGSSFQDRPTSSLLSDSSTTQANLTRSRVKTIKRIPRASRNKAASKFASIIEDVVALNDIPSWNRFFLFSPRCLRAPTRGGRRWNVTRAINQQIIEETDPPPNKNRSNKIRIKKTDPLELMDALATRVTEKLEEGDYRGAVRLVCSQESIAEINESTWTSLKLKHPAPYPNTIIPPAPTDDTSSSIYVTEANVEQVILSFPNGSAAGPDCLRPQHLKDMTRTSAEEGGPRLLKALTSMTNLILNGYTPETIRPLFFGANLSAFEKVDGGIRPIAVGCTIRRLAAKIAVKNMLATMGPLLAPQQLGFGTPHGAEAAVHAARCYLQEMPDTHILMKLDFKNAFNSIRRDKMLIAVRDNAPSIFSFVYSNYSEPSHLFWGDKCLESSEGVQQGDPLGPLLFCLCIHHIPQELKSELCLLYLDDWTLGGKAEDVIDDISMVEEAANELGLQLNRKKSEAICRGRSNHDLITSKIPDIQITLPEQATLLGSPLGNLGSISSVIREKLSILEIMGERLKYFQAQDALFLLRHSFALPKMLYILRTSPCYTSDDLMLYDIHLKSLTSRILNISFRENESAWYQATLPVGSGGLGIRSAVQLAPSAFIASAAASSDLVQHILPPRIRHIHTLCLERAMSRWEDIHKQPAPLNHLIHIQKSWDSLASLSQINSLIISATDDLSRARLKAASAKETGAWLNALPISTLGLRMDDETIRIAAGLRLGTPLCRPHTCHHCGTKVDQQATHGLSCRYSEGRHVRHAAINSIIHRSLSAAKIPSRLEPTGLSRTDGKRPDGASLIPWQSGKILVWDATCPDTFAPSHRAEAVSGHGFVADKAEDKKKSKYRNLLTTHFFVPVAIETSGSFGPEAASFVQELGRKLKNESKEQNSYAYLVQRLSVAVQRGNASAVLGTIHRQEEDEDDPFF